MDPQCAHPAQLPGALAGSSPRRHHIIHHPALGARHASPIPPPPPPDLEGSPHVRLPRSRPERSLRQRRARARQRRRHRHPRARCRRRREQSRLVVPALPPARRMQGHRNEHATRLALFLEPQARSQQSPQRLREVPASAVLQRQDPLARRRRAVVRETHRPSETGCIRPAGCARRSVGEDRRERERAPSAAGPKHRDREPVLGATETVPEVVARAQAARRRIQSRDRFAREGQ